jgi:hypothetical protein
MRRNRAEGSSTGRYPGRAFKCAKCGGRLDTPQAPANDYRCIMHELQDAHRDVGRGQARDENSEPANRMSL